MIKIVKKFGSTEPALENRTYLRSIYSEHSKITSDSSSTNGLNCDIPSHMLQRLMHLKRLFDCCRAKRALRGFKRSCFLTGQDTKMMLVSFCSDYKVLDRIDR